MAQPALPSPENPPAPNPGLTAQGPNHWEVIIVGGGLAGVSAAIYLGRALRKTLIIDNGGSLALWEPEVQNYLGFPQGISGQELLERGRKQACSYGAEFVEDTIQSAAREEDQFMVMGKSQSYSARRLLLATGLYHLPPDIAGVSECIGQSMFFCKDCDAYRVQGKRIAVVGRNNEAVDYGLAMLLYSSCVMIATNGKAPGWDPQHDAWIKEYRLPVFQQPIVQVEHEKGQVLSLSFGGRDCFAVDSIFTTRGDVYHNTLAVSLGAALDDAGQVCVDEDLRTTVPGLYAAGCVTPANCQMVVAAGQGAAAAQAVNRDLFQESLRNHTLRQFRAHQLRHEQTLPNVLK